MYKAGLCGLDKKAYCYAELIVSYLRRVQSDLTELN